MLSVSSKPTSFYKYGQGIAPFKFTYLFMCGCDVGKMPVLSLYILHL